MDKDDKCKAKDKKDIVTHQVTCYPEVNGNPVSLYCAEGESLLEAVRRQGIYLSASCGGRGTCGKCRIQVLEGEVKTTASDRRFFSENEWEQGYRLSCRAYPIEDCTIRITAFEEESFETVTEYKAPLKTDFPQKPDTDEYAIAIDLGTTTLALRLLGNMSGNSLGTYTTVNRQRAYGADVISRIRASNEGNKEVLRTCIQKDLLRGLYELTAQAGIETSHIRKIAIAGNTTMGHLLMGYSCETLGTYPYTPVNIQGGSFSFHEVFGTEDCNTQVIILPGISTFVGADIVAGLLACSFDLAEKPSLFIDLGTNGEMAVGNKDKILVCSTAAGPAFEGGNISCGTGSIEGAISGVTLRKDRISYETIGQKAPIGICGTGILELASELMEAGLMDETGLLCEPYFENGFEVAKGEEGKAILFLQKDIRELQLAKASVRAGVEILLSRYGIGYDDIDTVYLAGGFGYKTNVDKAVRIGLLPESFLSKIKAVGNSALGGVEQYLLDDNAASRAIHLLEATKEIQLSEDDEFQELYIKYMYFNAE